MRKAIRVGRLYGVDLALDTSWIFIFALVVWSLTSVFQGWHPMWTGGTAFTVALVTGMAFFVSVLFHEVAHVVAAKLYGLPVGQITLHMFGGVSKLEREPPTPGAELVIAVVGPVASVVLGVALLAIARLATGMTFRAPLEGDGAAMLARLGPTTTLLMWLGPVNVVIGIFNLIPGFPLDGGRILRAVLWRSTGDRRTATRWSTAVGQAVGLSFVAAGAAMAFGVRLPFFGSGLGAGIWLAIIGLFLRGSARQHQAGADVADALAGVPVDAVMRRNAAGIPANTSIRALVDHWFSGRDEGAFPVFFGERFVGLVTVEDVAKVPWEEWGEHTAREIMTDPARLPALAPLDPVIDALRAMGATGVRGLPVFDDGAVVGMLFERDIARWIGLERSAADTTRHDRPRHA